MIIIKAPQTREDYKAYYHLRYQVLREPIGLVRGTEKDDYEPISQHFMAIDSSNQEVVGVVKLFERTPGVGQFSHLAVSSAYQHQGVGKMLLQTVESRAKEMGFATLGTMTRLNATSFYEKFGYRITGFTKSAPGRPTLTWMEKNL